MSRPVLDGVTFTVRLYPTIWRIGEATDGDPNHYNLRVTQGERTTLYENIEADPPDVLDTMLSAAGGAR